MRVALVQTKSSDGDPQSNLRSMEEAIGNTNADLFIFPEMFLTGYDIDMDRRKAALILQDGILGKVAELAIANDCHVMVGAPIVEGDAVFDSLLFFKPDGDTSRYDKLHLAEFGPFHEARDFQPGSSPLMVDIEGFRFGLSICYDLFFPEMHRNYALQGTEALVCISASPRTSKTAFETVLPARAVENTCYMLFVNNTGMQGETSFFGGSRVINPSGRTLEEASEDECVLTVTLDKKEIARARANRPTLRDSRRDIWTLG